MFFYIVHGMRICGLKTNFQTAVFNINNVIPKTCFGESYCREAAFYNSTRMPLKKTSHQRIANPRLFGSGYKSPTRSNSNGSGKYLVFSFR